jgi:hypothetical protein
LLGVFVHRHINLETQHKLLRAFTCPFMAFTSHASIIFESGTSWNKAVHWLTDQQKQAFSGH